VAAGEQGDQGPFDYFVLADDDLGDEAADRPDQRVNFFREDVVSIEDACVSIGDACLIGRRDRVS